ncbi:hypothetical protein [Psychrobacter sp. I-STPA6b]|uniref:hypothetical protein n=1 Tax=Psychrobacter sp. I-STPA6b TaxID=2585718 RepID=UPI001D0C6209|nr:hypothetical protein [Psychrobacter sp. I-STPA6b]
MMGLGGWIAVAIVLFVLGSIMALKPSGVEQRLDKLRMTARRLQLNPKLIACPSWIRGKDNEYGSGMIAQYALILPNIKLPETRYQVIDGQLRPVLAEKPIDNLSDSQSDSIMPNYHLDKEPLALPERIAPFVKAVYSKANSMVIFWDDSAYVKPNSNPQYCPEQIEPDLMCLKERLSDWAMRLNPN